MEEGGRGRGGADESTRPSISIPTSSGAENFFRGEPPGELGPSPMALVSSFFAEDPEPECRSFSQILAGAIATPAAAPEAGRRRGGGSLNLGHSRPMNLLVAQSPFFTVPAGLSPGSLLDSPAIFSSNNLGQFGLAHQQAQVTPQGTHCHAQMHFPAQNPSSLSPASLEKGQKMPAMNFDTNPHKSEATIASGSDQRYQPVAIVADKPADDGYNWRKYGQKQVKGSEYPRSYYKCTHPNCPVKKNVERSLDGQVTEIIYKGKHNHPKPPSNKQAKEGNMSSGSAELNGHNAFPTNHESLLQGDASHLIRSSNGVTGVPKRDRESGHRASEQFSGSSDDEEVDHIGGGRDEAEDCGEPDQKKRSLETASHRTATEPRIIVQTTSEVDLLDDGYRWRKYGQKVVKGNPHPRSYYKCTSVGCNVRKHVERASIDPKAVITTYEGKHNHDVPSGRNSSHNTATAAANCPKPQNLISTDQNSHGRSDLINNMQRPVAVLQLKEEHKIA